MAALHLVSSIDGLAACTARAMTEDVIVLMHDGCYASAEGRTCYRLAAHAAGRGLTANAMDIDFDRLVELTTQHQPIVTWR